ncbi:hypothetical protein OH76DRAFT_1062680 [Lentinus brumalis]|uniref:DUF6533 domain-containing protein n=1 Tax=Lentinus brumalis TaxID=2498619 RepID=A0A371DNH9_9APHY|nr:hypothetical protein OH76DRAFT_1062680 [Polyporus brumalis]
MSSNAAAAATVALFGNLYTGSFCAVATSVLFIYDAFVTFDSEVACFWSAARTGASLLFFANKWLFMASRVMLLYEFASFPSNKMLLLPNGVTGNFDTAVHARSSKPLGLLVLALSLAPVGANLVPYGYQLSGQYFPPLGCLQTDNTTAALNLSGDHLSSTGHRCGHTTHLDHLDKAEQSGRSERYSKVQKTFTIRHPLSRWYVSPRIIYFVVLFVLNLLHLVFTATAVAGDGSNADSIIPTFTAPLTAIIVSRFLLELQAATQTVVRLDPDDPLHSSRNPYDSTPRFISSLGGFINMELPVPSDDVLEVNVGSYSDGEDRSMSFE